MYDDTSIANTVNDNKALIRRLFDEEIHNKDLHALRRMAGIGYVSHNDSVAPSSDLEQSEKFLASVFASFPDLHVKIEDILGEGDKVMVRNTWHGTFRGAWMGIAPTGKETTWTGIVLWRITDGKIKERWANTNFPEVMQKIAASARAHHAT